jgi:hypothetical protein
MFRQTIIAGVIDTGEQLIAGISDNGNKHKVVKIYTIFFLMAPKGYSGTRRKLIHEKNLRSKISCQTLFNDIIFSLFYFMLFGVVCVRAVCSTVVKYLFQLLPFCIHFLTSA